MPPGLTKEQYNEVEYNLTIGKIPSVDFAEVLTEYMAEHDLNVNELEIKLGRTITRRTGRGAGFLRGDGTLAKHLSGAYKWVGFELVDDVLTKLHLVEHWHAHPLCQWYQRVDLRSKEERRKDRQARSIAANRVRRAALKEQAA